IIFVKLRWPYRQSRQADDPRGVEKRRHASGENLTEHRPIRMVHSPVLDDGSDDGREVPGPDSRVHSQEGRAVVGTERTSEVEDAGRVQVRNPIAVRIHANIDHADELHQIGDGLSDAIGEEENGSWWGSADAFVVADRMVAVLVDATAASREGHRYAIRLIDGQRAKRA